MDEITMFAALQPDPPAEQDPARERIRAALGAPARRKRGTWRWRAGVGIAAVATTAIALVATTGGGPRPAAVVTAAWTVRENPGGTITIEFRQFANLSRLRRTLAADGVTAIVVSDPVKTVRTGKTTRTYPACSYSRADLAPRSVQRAVFQVVPDVPGGWVVHPSLMPRGSALFITSSVARAPAGTPVFVAVSIRLLRHDRKPACIPTVPPGR